MLLLNFIDLSIVILLSDMLLIKANTLSSIWSSIVKYKYSPTTKPDPSDTSNTLPVILIISFSIRGTIFLKVVSWTTPLWIIFKYKLSITKPAICEFILSIGEYCKVINEILPETYGFKRTTKSAFAVFSGFIFMTYLSMVLD